MTTKISIAFMLILFSLTSSFSKDSLDLPVAKIGLGFLYETVFEKQRNRTLSDKNGHGFGLSAYYETKILAKVSFSTGLNFRYKNFREQISQTVDVQNSDTTAFVHQFQLDNKLAKFAIPLNFRFQYFKHPDLYLLVGFSPEFTFHRQQDTSYEKTFIKGKAAAALGETVQSFVPFQDIDQTNFNLKIDLGIGFALKKTAIELLFRYDAFSEHTTSIGLRLRQQVYGIKRKKKKA